MDPSSSSSLAFSDPYVKAHEVEMRSKEYMNFTKMLVNSEDKVTVALFLLCM